MLLVLPFVQRRLEYLYIWKLLSFIVKQFFELVMFLLLIQFSYLFTFLSERLLSLVRSAQLLKILHFIWFYRRQIELLESFNYRVIFMISFYFYFWLFLFFFFFSLFLSCSLLCFSLLHLYSISSSLNSLTEFTFQQQAFSSSTSTCHNSSIN